MKLLNLRLDTSLYNPKQLQAIKNCFNQFFSEVIFLDIVEQRKQVAKLIADNPNSIVVSMDKYIPTGHDLDASRVYDLESNYLYHNIKFKGKIARNQDVILYDHDKVGGLGIKLVTALLEVSGNTVREHVLIELSKEEAKVQEILDLDDFLGSGLVCEVDGKLQRINYHQTMQILEKRASIPYDQYSHFCVEIGKLIKILLSPTN